MSSVPSTGLAAGALILTRRRGRRSVEAVYREYYETLAQAAESGLFDIIGHSGNIAFHGFRPSEAVEQELEEAFLVRAARLPVVIEINSGGLLRVGVLQVNRNHGDTP
jgi:histidinol phosphatase-like PHP family hydrolase